MRAWPVFALAVLLVLAGHGRDRFDTWVNETRLPPILTETSVEVLDRNGVLLRPYTVETGRWRLAVTPDGVSQNYVDMLVRYEDKRFWSHPGVDLRAMARAVAQAVWHGRVVSGGSTLTMQVGRLLENSGTGRVPGKFRQIRLALALERRLNKQDILALYLLHAPFGGNLEGVRAASLAYFGKEPLRLNTAEAALLVALPQAPESRRPDLRPEAARRGRDRVLLRLETAGVLEPRDVAQAQRQGVPRVRRNFPNFAAHVSDRVRREAPIQKVHHTTLDQELQAALEAKLTRYLARDHRKLSAAILVLDHLTGEVLASIGSPGLDTSSGHVDLTQAVRSPGSTLKPLVYGLAYQTGRAHPLSVITDGPIEIAGYAPRNFDGAYRGDVSLTEALQLSLNTPVVQLTEMITPARLVASLRQAGLSPQLRGQAPGLAVALGGVGTTLQDLVILYAGIAQGGRTVPMHWRSGETQPSTQRFLDPASAWHVSDALWGLAPPPGAPRNRLAYKTGTSYGHRDAWAIGFDGRYTIGVWIGRPDGTAVPGIFGAALAAPLLFDVAQIVSSEGHPRLAPPEHLRSWTVQDLPQHLARVGARSRRDNTGFKLTFPPDGARLRDQDVTLKLTAGQPPFAVLLNDTPVLKGQRSRVIPIDLGGPGYFDVTVLDATGASSRVHLELRN
ncbi:MAG: penicillin-binding protein 1C [Marinovum sp.]|nr:penicillin-binding protein 1C [Marinovum sp.]